MLIELWPPSLLRFSDGTPKKLDQNLTVGPIDISQLDPENTCTPRHHDTSALLEIVAISIHQPHSSQPDCHRTRPFVELLNRQQTSDIFRATGQIGPTTQREKPARNDQHFDRVIGWLSIPYDQGDNCHAASK